MEVLLVRLSMPLGECPNMYGHGSIADPGDVRVAADDITDKHRLLELKGINRHGNRTSLRAPACNDTAGNIDL
jgi:hypothetical protein